MKKILCILFSLIALLQCVPVKAQIELSEPSNITTDIEYDAKNNEYMLIKRVGDCFFVLKCVAKYE